MGSIRAFPFEEGPNRPQQDVKVECRGPVLDVELIEADRLLGSHARSALDLPPPRDARADFVTRPEELEVRRDLFGWKGTGTDQAHLAPKDVEQLGHLVQAPSPQPSPDSCESRVALQLEVGSGRIQMGRAAFLI